jgi:two-component system, chemotaxis family, response regulator PixG
MIAVPIDDRTLTSVLTRVSQNRSTGELIFKENNPVTPASHCWRFYFFYGRLIYATGDFHRLRRWKRILQQHCPTVRLPLLTKPMEPWEYGILSQAVTAKQIGVAQARQMVKSSLEEALFFLLRCPTLESEWRPMPRFALQDNFGLSLLLSLPHIELALHQAQRLCQQWNSLELGALHPYLTPRLIQPTTPSDTTLPPPQSLGKYLMGRHTLWDMAVAARCSVAMLAKFLMPWVQRGVVALVEVPDWSSAAPPSLSPSPQLSPVLPHSPTAPHQFSQPVPQPSVEPSPAGSAAPSRDPSAHPPLIACIDDSPTVGRFLEAILVPAGYRLITIQDSLSGIATLVQHRPDLIFLDLIMPETSGHNLCSFLRRTQVFQHTPIIVLTSQDKLVDRTRAMLAGATDFISKPPDPQAMLQLIELHLSDAHRAKRVDPQPKISHASSQSA